MKCELCGRQYIALGVHLRRKHKVDPDDYREQYGMLRAVPLVDDWLSDRFKERQHQRLKNPEYKEELQNHCVSMSKKNIGRPNAGMSLVGKKSIAEHDKRRNEAYLIKQSVHVARVLQEKGTMLDVRRDTGTGATAGKKMAEIAGVAYSRESAKIERDKRAAATIRAKALARVAKVVPYLNTTKSAAEMCRLAGISLKTYKNWLAAGFIARHPNGRGARVK